MLLITLAYPDPIYPTYNSLIRTHVKERIQIGTVT